MHRQIFIIAILSVIAAPTAVAKELPLTAAQAGDSGTSATLEIVDQKKTIKLACETFQVEAWAPGENDHGDSTSVSCGGTSIDANSPLLWEYANKKQQLEKAVLSIKYGKGQPYMIEAPNAVIAHIEVLGDSLQIELSAASSRLMVLPQRQ